MVGMGATVMDGAMVEAGAIVGAGALVPPGATIPANQIWAGSPAKFIRELAEGEGWRWCLLLLLLLWWW